MSRVSRRRNDKQIDSYEIANFLVQHKACSNEELRSKIKSKVKKDWMKITEIMIVLVTRQNPLNRSDSTYTTEASASSEMNKSGDLRHENHSSKHNTKKSSNKKVLTSLIEDSDDSVITRCLSVLQSILVHQIHIDRIDHRNSCLQSNLSSFIASCTNLEHVQIIVNSMRKTPEYFAHGTLLHEQLVNQINRQMNENPVHVVGIASACHLVCCVDATQLLEIAISQSKWKEAELIAEQSDSTIQVHVVRCMVNNNQSKLAEKLASRFNLGHAFPELISRTAHGYMRFLVHNYEKKNIHVSLIDQFIRLAPISNSAYKVTNCVYKKFGPTYPLTRRMVMDYDLQSSFRDVCPSVPEPQRVSLDECMRLPSSVTLTFVDTLAELETAIEILCASDVVGCDCEWTPPYWAQLPLADGSYVRGDSVAIMQLATESHAFIVDMISLMGSAAKHSVIKLLAKLFRPEVHSSSAHIVGFEISGDIKQLRRSYHDLWFLDDISVSPIKETISLPVHSLKQCDLPTVVDISTALYRVLEWKQKQSLAAATEQTFGKPLSKNVRMSDWTMRPLNQEQMEYAALDAWILVELTKKLILTST